MQIRWSLTTHQNLVKMAMAQKYKSVKLGTALRLIRDV